MAARELPAGETARARLSARPAEPILSLRRIGELGGVSRGLSVGSAATDARFGRVRAAAECTRAGCSGQPGAADEEDSGRARAAGACACAGGERGACAALGGNADAGADADGDVGRS